MSSNKRLIGLFSGLLIVALTLPAAADESQGQFSDDDGIPVERNIEWVAEIGLMTPCDTPANSRFCPYEPVEPAEVATALIRSGKLDGVIPALPVEVAASRLASLPSVMGIVPDRTVQAGNLAMLVAHVLGSREIDEPVDPTEVVDRGELAEMLAVAMGADQCPEDPFTEERVASLDARYSGQSFQAYVYDTRTGCAFWINPEERMRPASVFKVMVLGGTLLEAQADGRDVTESEMERLVPMITESANWPVRSLWRSFGAAPWFTEQTEIFGLDETNAVGDHGGSWGATRTSAKDQADLIRQILLGDWGPLDVGNRAIAFELMTSVLDSQTWGVTNGVPDGWAVAQKNGFAGRTTNSVGYVEEPAGDGGYVVAILTHGWPGWRAGVEVVEEIAGWVSEALAHRIED